MYCKWFGNLEPMEAAGPSDPHHFSSLARLVCSNMIAVDL